MDSYTADTEMAQAHADTFRMHMRVVSVKDGRRGMVTGLYGRETRAVCVLFDGEKMAEPMSTDHLEKEGNPELWWNDGLFGQRGAGRDKKEDSPMITYEQALTVNEFHENHAFNADGTCVRWRRNGKTQTWKTRPGHFRIPVKYGLYGYGNITHNGAADVHAASDCPHKH